MSEFVARLFYRERETRVVRSAQEADAARAEGFGPDVPRCWWASYDPAAEPAAEPAHPPAPKRGRR